METPSPALRVRGVRRRFDGTLAVDGLDLDVATGTVTALLGPSGCGKTTALRCIAGLLAPDEGTVELAGRLVVGPGVDVPPERRRVGMVFQDYALFPHLPVAANVAFGIDRLESGARRRRVAEVLELVGLTGLDERLPAELSGGQQQRVALARALAPQPELLLLDEPFSNLDAGLRTAVREDVRRILHESGTTAVFVTHDQEEALSLADEVAVMAAGRLHQVAAPHLLYTRPASAFVARFVGDADVIAGRRRGRSAVATAVGVLTTVDEVTADAVEVVVRPETLLLEPAAHGGATVLEVTYFGHDQLVRLRLDDGTILRSRQGPTLTVRPGDRVATRVAGDVVAFPLAAAPPTAVHA